MVAGGVVFSVGREICAALGVTSYKNPAFWVTRSLAWMVFASAAGVVYGLVDRSLQKGRYGVLGAVIGGGIGGVLFFFHTIFIEHRGPQPAGGVVFFILAPPGEDVHLARDCLQRC